MTAESEPRTGTASVDGDEQIRAVRLTGVDDRFGESEAPERLDHDGGGSGFIAGKIRARRSNEIARQLNDIIFQW